MAKVSVILTVYNKPEWLHECIDSVLNQTLEDWELVILEDNSPDPDVCEIINSYDDPRLVKYYSGVSEKNRYKTARYATLINIGVPMSKGKYVTYLTDDDFYYPTRLEVMSRFLDDHPKVHVVYGPQAQVGLDGKVGGMRETCGILDEAFNKVDHNSVMHTRKAFDVVGGWDDNPDYWGGADAYFWKRLNEKGYRFYPVSDSENPLDAKRYHGTNVQRLIAEGNFFPER